MQNKSSTTKYFTREMLVPKYVTEFQCIGGDCPDTCCSTWSITVDKDTFQRYRREIHPVVKPLLKEFLVQINKASNGAHGMMNIRPSDARCGLISTDSMCQIQQHLGEDALSDTCYTYPRSVVQVGGAYEQCLTLSCPEAARLALTCDDAFEFVSDEFTSRLATTRKVAAVNGFSIEAMTEVRIFVIQLFQTLDLSNVERLVAVGWLCQQIDLLVANQTQGSVETLLEDMRTMIESGRIRSTVGQLAEQIAPGATLFSILFGAKMQIQTHGRQREVLERVRSGLAITPELNLIAITNNYARGRQLLKSDGGLCEKLLSRYLLNDLVRETFPWTQTSAMQHYRRLLTRYGVLRMMLAGIAAELNAPHRKQQLFRPFKCFAAFINTVLVSQRKLSLF